MKIILALFCLGLAVNAVNATDASAPIPQPLAPSPRLKTAGDNAANTGTLRRRLPSPTISETSVVRRPDGSLALNCVEKPNPKAHAPIRPNPQSQAPQP